MRVFTLFALAALTGCLQSPELAAAAPLSVSHASAAEPAAVKHETCNLTPREVVEEFAELLYRQKNVRLAFETWVDPDYIQHKPVLPDGREPVIEFLENLFVRYPDRIFSIHRIIAEGDLVAVHYHSQATRNDLGFAVVDIFRVENCRLVEHWDVVQPVPENSRNDNTMF